MAEPDPIHFECIGCGTLNPAGAAKCAGCGYEFAGPIAEPPQQPNPTGRRSIDEVRAQVRGISLPDERWVAPRSAPRNDSIGMTVLRAFAALLIAMLILLAGVMALVLALMIAFFVMCSGGRVDAQSFGIFFVWLLVVSLVIWLIMVLVRWMKK